MRTLPKNVWLLAITFSFAMSGISLLIFVGGLIGTQLAPSEKLATLPIAIFVVGNALATLPASFLSQLFGRKRASYIGFSTSLSAALICALAIQNAHFYAFCAGSFLVGCGTAFYHQFRFAAIESLNNPNDAGPAISVILLCSIVGAVVGPELATAGKNLLKNSPDYTASFGLFALMIGCAMAVFAGFTDTRNTTEEQISSSRPLYKLVFNPKFLNALAAAAIGYALMSFLMTSTPISMHLLQGHSLSTAKWVIQSHMAAMFLPSLFSGYLVKKFGAELIMLFGALCYLLVILIALSGQHVMHYWWALVLLGVGWNFLFLSGTTLLPLSYAPKEKFKAQAINDFTVFSLQACASLSAAWVLFRFGWSMQVWMCLPFTLILVCAATYQLNERRKSKA